MDMKQLKMVERPISELKGYARNPRKNDDQVDRMVESISQFGFRIPVVAKSDGSVIDGHLRLKAAQRMGMKSVPVVLADELTDAQVKAFRLLANRSANWADWDVPMLAAELQDLQADGFDLAMTGFSQTEIDDVLESLDINFSGEEAAGIDGDGFGHNSTRVKVCLDAEVIGVLEDAIAKTGQNNRAEAVREICEAYLEKR